MRVACDEHEVLRSGGIGSHSATEKRGLDALVAAVQAVRRSLVTAFKLCSMSDYAVQSTPEGLSPTALGSKL